MLGAVPDGQLTLERAHDVVSDALLLLGCKEIKISASSAGTDEAPDDAGEAVANARGKLLSQVARKATVEAIVPIVIEMKRYLEAQTSPLLRDLFRFLRELTRDHKQHLQDILSRDRQLAKEIEYDMRQLGAQPPPTPRALRAISPGSGANAQAATGGGAHTPQRKTATKAMSGALRVPTPDKLRSALSIPKLRVSMGGASVGGTPRPQSGKASGGGSAFKAPLPPASSSEADAVMVDVVMQSPFKEAPPPRQWAVCPSPGAKALFD